jgi:predicted alpha/beta-hydrolase family hydrolase
VFVLQWQDRRVTTIDVGTPHGDARVHVRPSETPRGGLILGHGAGGGIEARDLVAATEAAVSARWTVALVEHPYRVAGRRSPPRAPVLDAVWVAVVEELAADRLAGLPLVTGGRSLGGRVACRTAAATNAVGVICLAFPLEPPARGDKPRQSRLEELDAVNVPVLVVQGESDPYGMPPSSGSRTVVKVAGDHGLKKDPDAVAAAVGSWLVTAVPAARTR